VSVTDIAAAVRDMLILALLLVSPFLAAATLTSLIVGLLQASTRINDLTLSFVPRLVATLLAIYLGGGWAIGRLAADLERAALAARLVGG
jgi:flagellar biosynthesis protein FliQ